MTQRTPTGGSGLSPHRPPLSLGRREIRQTPFSVDGAVLCAQRVFDHLRMAMVTRTYWEFAEISVRNADYRLFLTGSLALRNGVR